MVWLKYISVFSVFLVVRGLSENLDHVERDAIVDDKTLQEKWNLMESRIQDSVQNAVKLVLPRAIEASSSLNISSLCIKEALKIVSGLKKMKIWAAKFFDASSKSIDGLLGNYLTSLGNYDECINNEVVDERPGLDKREVLFRGKYCTVLIKPYLPPKPKRIRLFQTLEGLKNFTSKDTIIGEIARFSHFAYSGSIVSLALCVPSGCSEGDLNQVLGKVADYMGIIIKTSRCEVKEEVQLTWAMIAVLVLYSIAGILVLVGSLIDFYYSQRNRTFRSTFIRVLTAFSFISNFRKLIDTSVSSETFRCLHGIKALSIAWIMLAHTYLCSTLVIHKIPYTLSWPKRFLFQAVFNGTLAVNTFFFISGMLVCYGSIKSFALNKKRFNVLMYVLHRLFRVFPVCVFVTAFYFLVPLLGSGPLYHNAIDTMYKPCVEKWWANLLFISNYYQPWNMCVIQGWYLSLDMQLYIGSLVILLPLMRWPKIGITVAVTISVASMIGSGLEAYIYDIPPTFLFTPDLRESSDVFTHGYSHPQIHAGSYCIGILCGYLLVMYPNLKIPKGIKVLGWCSSIVIIISVVHSVQKWNSRIDPTFWETVFYASCHRVAWTLAVAWIIVCCCTGHGGIVNYILSWPVWVPIGRMSLLIYLIGPLVQLMLFYSMKTEFLADHIVYVSMFFSSLVISYMLSFGGSMLVEMPFLSLGRILFSKTGNSGSSNLKEQENHTVQDKISSQKKDFMEVRTENGQAVSENKGGNNVIFVQRL